MKKEAYEESTIECTAKRLRENANNTPPLLLSKRCFAQSLRSFAHHPPEQPLAISPQTTSAHAHAHENEKVKVVVTQPNIIVNELPKKEAVGYAYDWLRRQQRKKEQEEKKLKKLDRKMKKLTKHRKK